MSLDDALFLVQRSGTLHHSKGSDIGDRMVAGDMVLVQRNDQRFKATYDGNEWSTIRDSDLLLAWDGTNNRKVTGANFKGLFKDPYGGLLGIWKRMYTEVSCSYDGSAYYRDGSKALEIQYNDSDGVDHHQTIVDHIDLGNILYCVSSVHGVRGYNISSSLSSSRCRITFYNPVPAPWDDWDKNTKAYLSWLQLWLTPPGPFNIFDWKAETVSGSACDKPNFIYYDRQNRSVFLPYSDSNGDSLNEWYLGIAGTSYNFLPLWLEFDDGYMLQATQSICNYYLDNYSCTLQIYDKGGNNRFAEGMHPTAGGKIKAYNFFPGQFRDEIRGHLWERGRGATSITPYNTTRLDQNGNVTSSSTWYGSFIPYTYINGSQGPFEPLYGYEGFEASHELGIAGVTGSVMGVESTDPTVTLDMVAMSGTWGIRIWGKKPETSSTGGTINLRGLPLRRA